KVNQSLFIREVKKEEWMGLSQEEKKLFTQQLCDVYEGTGIPFKVADKIYHHPAEIFALLQEKFAANKNAITFESLQTETSVLVEEFIKGKEFSCIVVEGENGEPIALPPTEIIKTEMIFNYRAKYLPGISRKVTPINIEEEKIIKITKACESLYTDFGFDVYARIDGIIREDGKIFLNDPNTTSGMLPSSFFFHQAAEIGLSPGQFLTYIIWRSLVKRRAQSHRAYSVDVVLKNLEEAMANKFTSTKAKPTVAVVLGGNSSERHISVESGRNVYEKLSSSGHYNTLPVFLDYTNNVMRFFILPLNLLLKDNADDIREKSKNYLAAPIIKKIIEKAGFITQKFASKNYEFKPKEISLDELCTMADSVFIALHGRPGEDGTLQTELEKYGKPYNGSGPYSSNNTINKFITNEMFKEAGLLIPKHLLINKEDWEKTHEEVLGTIADKIGFPIIAKPADDGCSSAVKKIDTPQELVDYAHGVFRNQEAINIALRELLSLKENEEFPMKNFFVVEELVKPNGAEYFLEITGGMLAKTLESGEIIYEVFEPSEALASKGILSLEEKFLAGEGQNITPARFSKNPEYNKKISSAVKEKLEQAARILQVEGYCRIDAFVRIYSEEKVEVIFIEINSLPGLTPATCIFHQAAINGYKPFEFLDKIIDYGKEKATLATAK
ncbi:MAG: D-alanine--D-alanine ligase, partial [Bacteroidetes bacterium]|nr:D-alanine--D-alanine ligase [Bacteroidota bacterium]